MFLCVLFPLLFFVTHFANGQQSSLVGDIPAEYMQGLTQAKMHLPKQNIDLHYVSGGDPKAADNLLVFLHGFPQFWYAWRHQLQFFSKKNYRVYAFDLRGFGSSDRPSGVRNYTIGMHLEDIAEAIEILKTQPENVGKNVALVTHDIGAAIGSMLAYHYPDLVNAFVAMNAPNPRTIIGMLKSGKLNVAKMLKTPYFYKMLSFQLPIIGERVVSGNNFAFFDKLFLTDDGAILNQGEGGTFDQRDLEVYKKAYSQPNAVTSALNFFRAPLRGALHDVGQLILSAFTSSDEKEESGKLPDKIKAKCLVIWGDQDATFGLEFGQAAVDACEQGKLVPVNSSHWVPEDVPQQVNQLIEQFVGNLA